MVKHLFPGGHMRHPFRALLASLALAALPALAGEDTYKIDPVHSEVSFKVSHLLAKVSGRFTKFEGLIKDLTADNEARDKHLKSPDFFDVAKFPVITFKSTAVKEVAKGKLEITGDFTLHGVTKRITFPITNAGTQPGMAPGTVIAGFIDGALTLNRNEFGIKTFPGVIGETVAVSLNAEAGKVAPAAKK